MTPDLVAVVEAAYAAVPTDAAWLDGVARAALPSLQRGGGVHAYFVDINAEERPMRDPILVGATPAWHAAWEKQWWDPFMAPMQSTHVRRIHSFTTVCHTTDLFAAIAAEVPTYDEYLSRVAKRHWGTAQALRGARPSASAGLFPDSFNVACIDGEGRGCSLVANLPDPATAPVPHAVARVWERVAAHVAAGYRLHRRARTADAFGDAEAILAPGGRALHATGVATRSWALDALRALAASRDRSRTRAIRRDPARALDAWHALALGRWTLVDCFDRDGRRFIVARPNEPRPGPRSRLTLRQTQVVELVALGLSNKLVAYQLGLSPSTVATHLAGAARKLGARSRVEVILRVRAARGTVREA